MSACIKYLRILRKKLKMLSNEFLDKTPKHGSQYEVLIN